MTFWQDKKENMEHDLESKVVNYYQSFNAEMTGRLRAQILSLANQYYQMFGEFYRRVWNGGDQYVKTYGKDRTDTQD